MLYDQCVVGYSGGLDQVRLLCLIAENWQEEAACSSVASKCKVTTADSAECD